MDKARIKAIHLFEEGKVIKEVETDKRIHFKVVGESETHSVIFDKNKREWTCDCKWSTLQKKECSHIVGAKILEGKSN